jgi:hypothetical protein
MRGSRMPSQFGKINSRSKISMIPSDHELNEMTKYEPKSSNLASLAANLVVTGHTRTVNVYTKAVRARPRATKRAGAGPSRKISRESA